MWKKLTRCQEHEFLLSDPKIAGKLKFRVRSSNENQIRNVSNPPPCELHSFRGGYFTEVSGFSYTNHWCMFWRKTRSISLHIILLFYYIFQWKHCSIFSSSVSTGTVLWSMFWQEYQSMFWRKYQSMFWRKYSMAALYPSWLSKLKKNKYENDHKNNQYIVLFDLVC